MGRPADLSGLEDAIARVRQLGKLPEAVAPDVADALESELSKQIAGGKDPENRLWPKTKDGRQALRGAMKAIKIRVFGSRVVATLTGPEARHHLGAVKGGVRRRILPDRKASDRLIAAVKRAVEKAVARG